MTAASLSAGPPPLARWQAVALRALVLAAILVRLYGVGARPVIHYTDDEFHYAWVGLTLLHEGKATAWSWLGAYEQYGLILGKGTWHSKPYQMVRPALDHPPLFSLLAGAFASLTGPQQLRLPAEKGGTYPFWQVDMKRVRCLSIILFVATYLLLFALAREALSPNLALLTLLFYGFIGTIILRNRLVVTENLSTPLLLLNLLYLVRYLAGRASRRAFALVTVLSVAAALLTKVVAATQAGIIVMLLLLAGRRREALYPLAGFLLGLALYLAYGAWQGWQPFLAILGSQSGRFDGFNILGRIIMIARYLDPDHFDVLLLAGWVSVFAQLLRRRSPDLFLTPLLYVLGYMFFASANSLYEWHTLPLYPFLCLGLAVLVRDAWRGADAPSALLLFFFLVPYACHTLFLSEPLRPLARPLFLVALGLLPVACLADERRRTNLTRLMILAGLALVFIFEIRTVFAPGIIIL